MIQDDEIYYRWARAIPYFFEQTLAEEKWFWRTIETSVNGLVFGPSPSRARRRGTVWLTLAEALWRRGDEASASACLRRAANENPEWAEPFIQEAFFDLEKKRWRKAEKNFARTLSLDPTNEETRFFYERSRQIP